MNISSNNIHFGRLKIDANAREKLNTQSNNYLDELKEIGKDIEDVNNTDVILDKDLNISVVEVNDEKKYNHFKRLKCEMENAGRSYYCECGGEGRGGFWPKIPDQFFYYYTGDVSEGYRKFQALDNLQQAAELSKMIDKSIIRKKEQELIKLEEEKKKELEAQKAENEHNQKINDVLSDFGFTLEKNNDKKSFLSKIFHRK